MTEPWHEERLLVRPADPDRALGVARKLPELGKASRLRLAPEPRVHRSLNRVVAEELAGVVRGAAEPRIDEESAPDDVLLVIEVADSSLDYDHAKLRIYAAAGVSEVWIVDLQADRVEVYRNPRGDA